MADSLKWLPHTRPLGLITTELNKETNYPPSFCHTRSPPPGTALSPAQAPLTTTRVPPALCPSMDNHTRPNPGRGWSLCHHPTTLTPSRGQRGTSRLGAPLQHPEAAAPNSPERESPPPWSRHRVGCAPRGAGGSGSAPWLSPPQCAVVTTPQPRADRLCTTITINAILCKHKFQC